jgi:hypothetical protein
VTLNSDPAKIPAWRARSKPLGRSRGLTRTGFTLHVVRGEGAAVIAFPEQRTQRYTGPTKAVRKLVLARDRYACVCCGRSVLGQPYSLQHRVARGMGGTSDPAINYPENLLTMLGTGTTGCHGRVESRSDPDDRKNGYWLHRGESPLLIPVRVFSGHGPGAEKYLTADGGYSDESPWGGAA